MCVRSGLCSTCHAMPCEGARGGAASTIVGEPTRTEIAVERVAGRNPPSGNGTQLGAALDLRPDDVGVSWLPLYHDMGLIGTWLTALYFGLPIAVMSPLVFLARPSRWLWSLHAHRGTVSPAPNFAYELCARRVPVDVRFVAKRELLQTPLIRTIIRKVGHLPVERVDLSRSLEDARAVGDALRAGASLVVFPEGTFADTPGLLPFRLGAFKAAVEMQKPIVPVAIIGTRAILGAGRLPRPGRIDVTLAAPIAPHGEGWPELVRLRDAARAQIAAITGERLMTSRPHLESHPASHADSGS